MNTDEFDTVKSTDVESNGNGTIDYSVDNSFAATGDSEKRKRISASTLLFGGVVVASVIGLWSMRTLSRSNAAISENTESVRNVREWVWNRTNNEFSAALGGLEIINRLDKHQLNALQVPVSDLRNPRPFRFDGEAAQSMEIAEDSSAQGMNPRDVMLDVWEGTIDEIGEQMKITAILAPDTPKAQAVLNGHRVMVGDVFYVDHMGDEFAFTVERIGPHGVVFLTQSAKLEHERRIQVDVDRGW
jgi:hypothetical protein